MGKTLIVVGLVFTLVATVFLYLGSKHLPWKMQSWKGETEKENRFFKTRNKDTTIGFILLFCGFLLQLIGVLTQN